ncbi:MAG: hypothetical protein IIA49_00610, partial [Bacteroidetes bacterium]|nr:hypothetical protein [Bacteroidota bacterium]
MILPLYLQAQGSRGFFEALLHEDSRLFNNIFRAYFVCGLVAAERVKRELADHPLETRLTLWADLVIDLLEITGYALVFHEISGVQVLGEVFGTWRRYISAQDDPKYLSNMTSGVLNYQRRNYKLSTRGVNRTSWGQAFARQMRERLLLSESLYSHGADAPVRA